MAKLLVLFTISMLPQRYRIPKKDIPDVVKRGKRFSNEYFDIKVWYEDIDENKFGVIIPKKVAKNATTRNRIKRIFRSAIFELEKKELFKPGKYIFLVKDKSLVDYKSNQIKDLIRNIF